MPKGIPGRAICSIEGCAKVVNGRGLCPMHYRRWMVHGDPMHPGRPGGDEVTRFWAYVNKTDECWVWLGGGNGQGYGAFNLSQPNKRLVLAYRYAYELVVGPVPDGLELDHLCRNRACVNPAHLEPVTHRENVLRGTSPAAQHASKTHCPQGHPYAGSNLIVDQGKRKCRECVNRRRMSRYYATRRAK